MAERRFSDEEMSLILREASEAREGGRRGASEGLSLEQIKDIAVEVGLDPAAVEAAAHRLVLHRAGSRVPFFGTPVTPEFEREVSGEVKEADMAELVTTIRKVLGRRGITEAELGAFEWKARDAMGGRYVSVLPKGGTTRLRVYGNFRDGMALTAMVGGMSLAMALTVVMAALGLKEVVGVGILPLAGLLSVLPIRQIWRWRYRKEEDTLAVLTEVLDGEVRRLVSRESNEGALPPGAE
ncbi:MAG: hypothetical protein AMXMBFR53_04540 [Gemmatimonadota bacterium]